MGLNAFTVLGNTCKMTAASSPPTPIQVSSSTLGGNQYRIINLSTTTTAFLSYAATAAQATTNCVIPTGDGANAQNCIPTRMRFCLSSPMDSLRPVLQQVRLTFT